MWNFKTQQQEKMKFFPAVVSAHRGFSFVELIITVAIFSLVFGGLIGAFQLMAALIGQSKAKAGALSLMSSQMEYIRSLPYNNIGTIGGVPSGTIPQMGTTTLNGTTYNSRILIQYVDDPADGTGGADSNGILADYKQAKIEYTWSNRGKTHSAALVSNIVPTGIESTAGGGTIRVNVFDATASPLAGAEVRFVNNTTTTTIDTLRYTDITGIAYLSGAPAGANYEITVTDTGFSSDGTYVATTSNPNPSTPPIAVLESQVSTMNFQIDRLSNLDIKTVGVASYDSFVDSFTDTSLLATTSSTTVTSGTLVLSGGAGSYHTDGSAFSTTTVPVTLDSWYSLSFEASTSASTSIAVSLLYDNAGVLTLIPESDLPGNSTGFTSSPVDITGLDIGTYPALQMRAILSTTDTTDTPVLHQWQLTHITAQPVISGVSLDIAGAKSIGTDASSQPVLKYTNSGTTNALGEWNQNNIEWDIYTVSMNSAGYSVYEMCPQSPYALQPGISKQMKITLGAPTAQLLRVTVSKVDGTPIPNANVRLQNTGVDQSRVTSLCGQTYFASGLYDDDNYTVTVSALGYATQTIASTTVSSTSTTNVILN